MTVTHIDNTVRNDPINDDVFVPRYAQARGRKKVIRTWMILAPIGALAVIGGGALMMSGENGNEPLVRADGPAPLIQPTTALESSTGPTSSANVSITETAPAPIVREAPPAPPPAIQRRQPAERRAAPVAAAAVVEGVPAEPTGPQSYSVAPAATATPTITERAPTIVPAPLD